MKRSSLILAFILCGAGWASAKDIELTVLKTAKKLGSLDPFDRAWKKAKAVEIPLMAQTIAPPGGGGGVKTVKIKAIQCESEILFRLEWEDATVDDDPSKSESFPDAVALQFPTEPTRSPSPFMGDPDAAVTIWRWSASAQKDLDSGYQSSTLHRPRMTADLYAYGGDSTFRTGEGAGNILSNRRRRSPVENLAAKGFGTLTVQHEQPVEGKGVWKKGKWHVVFRRVLQGTPQFWEGSRILFAVGVWNGHERERDGIKSVSVWQTLALPGAAPRDKKTDVAQGRRVYQRFGCGACHGVNAEGGVANPNAQTNPIPGLTKVKEGYTEEELLKIVYNGREPARADAKGAPPPFKMNAWKALMDPAEGKLLAAYLFSLMGETEDW